MRIGLSALLLTLPCLNYYGKNIHGYEIEGSAADIDAGPQKFIRELVRHEDHDEILRKDLGPEPAADADFHLRNDYAANLIRQGKTSRAIAILESIEKSHPGEYQVAANLGTAYELSGDPDRALQWVSEGIRRNPDIHYGTEWLHVRILEVKQELKKDPAWLQNHTVLDFDFGSGEIPVLPAAWGKMGQTRVIDAIRFQMHERLAFVSPPDPIVGDLLGVYADHVAVGWPVEYALPLYDLALSFKPVHAEILEKRRSRASYVGSIFFEIPTEALALGGVGLVGLLLSILLYRRLYGQPTSRRGPA